MARVPKGKMESRFTLLLVSLFVVVMARVVDADEDISGGVTWWIDIDGHVHYGNHGKEEHHNRHHHHHHVPPPLPPHSHTPPPHPPVHSPPPPVHSLPPPPPPPPTPKSSPPPPPPVHSPPPTPPPPPPPPPTAPKSSPPPPPPVHSPPAPPPGQGVSGVKRVRCRNKKFKGCYMRSFPCPATCPQTCGIDCKSCKAVCDCNKPGTICQDPRFIGGDGITFYFHGKKDRDFCIVTDLNLHINAHFIGRRNHRMKRDFTWVESLGVLFGTHKLFIGARKTETWDDANDRISLALDGKSISIPQVEGAEWISEAMSITRLRGTNAVLIDVPGIFQIKAIVVPITEDDSLIHNYGITQEDCFAHLDMSFKFYSLSQDVSGILGQTYAANYVSRAKMGMAVPVLGGEREFASTDLFTADCAASRFVGDLSALDNSTSGHVDNVLSCATGMDGPGVVCKR